MRFSIKDFFSKCDQETADLVTFAEEILNGELHFLCIDNTSKLRFPNFTFQSAFTCSKLTKETLEQGVKYFPMASSCWCLYC